MGSRLLNEYCPWPSVFVVRGAPPPTATASTMTPARTLPLPSRTVPDSVPVDPPGVGGAADCTAIAGAALDGGGATLLLAAAFGSVARGAAIGAAAVGGALAAGAAATGSTFAICVGGDGDGRSSITAMNTTARAATAALQAQRGRNQTDTEGACTSAARRTAARCAGVS